ncbi:MAG TPA: hypothetical protein VLE74_04210 [Candidatus Saccharimonadales bacterium]|nr:hypothetical protein [Candidatus Saccharimonadales bacterium]
MVVVPGNIPELGTPALLDLTFSEPHVRETGHMPKALHELTGRLDSIAENGEVGVIYPMPLGFTARDAFHEFDKPGDRDELVISVLNNTEHREPSTGDGSVPGQLTIVYKKFYKGEPFAFLVAKPREENGTVGRGVLGFSAYKDTLPVAPPRETAFEYPDEATLARRAQVAVGVAGIMGPAFRLNRTINKHKK